MVIRKLSKNLKKKLSYHIRRSCKCKSRYSLFKSIWKTIIKRFNGVKVFPYKCRYCKSYHIGHRSKNTIKRRNRLYEKLKMTLWDLKRSSYEI